MSLCIPVENITTREEFASWAKLNDVPDEDYSTVPNYYHYIGVEAARKLGHQQENFITDCTVTARRGFYPYQASCQEIFGIEFTPHPIYYNCYHINVNNVIGKDEVVDTIEFVLNTDHFDYTCLLSAPCDANVVNLFIHQQGTPFEYIGQDVLKVQAGQNLQVDVSFAHTEHLPDPYGTCRDHTEDIVVWNIYHKKYKYTRMACQIAAYQEHKHLCCDCISDKGPVLGFSNESLESFQICRAISRHHVYDYRCRKTGSCQTFKKEMEYASECPEVCRYITYKTQLSGLPWPSSKHLLGFHRRHIEGRDVEDRFPAPSLNRSDGNDEATLKQLDELVKDNFVMIKIQFDLNSILVYKDVQQFTFTSFLSAFGGLLNLYSGVSFVILIEIADFILSCFFKCFEAGKVIQRT